MYPSPLGQCVLTTARSDHLPNFLIIHRPLVNPRSLKGQGSGRLFPNSLGALQGVVRLAYDDSDLQPCSVSRSPPRSRAEAGDVEQGGCQGPDPPSPQGPRFIFVSAICHPFSRAPTTGSSHS